MSAYLWRGALAPLLMLSLTPAFAESPKAYPGVFEPKLVESSRGVSPDILIRATPEQLKQLPAPLAEGEDAFFGSIDFNANENGRLVPRRRIPLALVVSPGAVALYVNLPGKGAFTVEQKHVLQPSATGGTITPRAGDLEVWLDMSLPEGSQVASYPLHLIWSPERARTLEGMRKQEKERYLWRSSLLLQGSAQVDGRKVLVQYDFEPLSGQARGDVGNFGIDANLDGKIDPRSKAEFVFRSKDAPPTVFKLDDTYVSHGAVNAADRTFVLDARTAADFTFVEMKAGNVMPDYTFVDIEGKTRKLSEFRGKHVLYDFWGTWCGPCVAEIPFLREAYAKFRERGFEIVGIDKDSNLEQVKKFLKKHDVTWPQASTATPVEGEKLLAFITHSLRVQSFPTAILVDPEGKIISTSGKGELPLRGDGLAQTLDKVLPPKSL